MKFTKYLFFLFLIFIIGFAIYIAIQPNEFKFSKTRTIKAPTPVIYENVIDFKNWDTWWSLSEENSNNETKITIPEQTKSVNKVYSWKDKYDSGTVENVDVISNLSIQQKIQFKDFPLSNVLWQFKTNTNGITNVTWTLSRQDLPFGFKARNILNGGIENKITAAIEARFDKLESAIAKSMKIYTVNLHGEIEYGGGFYMYKTTSATAANINAITEKQFKEIEKYMNQNNIFANGMPFTLYNEVNKENGSVIMSQAIPIRDKVKTDSISDVLCGYTPKTKAIKTTLKGDYTNLKEAWNTTRTFIEANQFENSDLKPFEIYITDPNDVPNPADWITEIYIPIN